MGERKFFAINSYTLIFSSKLVRCFLVEVIPEMEQKPPPSTDAEHKVLPDYCIHLFVRTPFAGHVNFHKILPVQVCKYIIPFNFLQISSCL